MKTASCDGTKACSAAIAAADGTENHAPLPDFRVYAITAGVNGYLRHGLRLSMYWQGIVFGDISMAPDYLPPDGGGNAPAGVESGMVQHVFLRAQLSF